MADLVATRTLVKSPPELWEELSDVDGLSRHLGEFGEIRISRLEPETAIAWEAERASGTVEIEASSWGTKVVLTAELPEAGPIKDAEPVEPAPPADLPPAPMAEESAPEPAEGPPRTGFFSRWLFRERRARPAPEVPEPDRLASELEQAEAEPEPAPAPAAPGPEPEPEPDSTALDEDRARTVLEETLDTLGSAHNRPFSRG